MLGFVGTIAGVIKIFYNISLADNISIGVISGGLYEKMIASGTGLIVGVVAYSGYHILSIMIDKYMSRIEQEAFEFTNIIQNNKG
jgi:biopolymer transport protein ExbB